jgi:hypothetical protein
MADKKKGVQLTESLARRLVGMLHEFERRERQSKVTRRIPKSSGYIPIMRFELTEDLLAGSSANATLLSQDPDDGTWTAGTSPDDDEEIYDPDLIEAGMKLATGQLILAYRNPASGLLNLLQSSCPVPA